MAAPDPGPAALAQLRGVAARRLAERAADPTAALPELRDLQERLRLIDAGLAAQPASGRRRWPPALWPVLAVAALVSVAAAVPVRSVPFTLELQAQAVTLELGTAGELGSQPVDAELRIEGQTRLDSPAAAMAKAAVDSGADPVVLRAPQLTLRRVTYAAGTTLVVTAGRQVQLGFDAPRPPLAAEVEFAGNPTSWRIGDAATSAPADFAHAEWLRASAGDPAQPDRRPPPLALWLARAAGKSYAWSGLRPVALQFIERRAGATGSAEAVVASSLEQAHLTLPATGGDVKLGAGDRLEIGGLAVERFELVAGDSVGIKLSGSARVLATRTGDFERSLKPSLLEFLARHHTLSLFWSSALMLWGAIAWLRKQFDSPAA